jgi:hypothetical protein
LFASPLTDPKKIFDGHEFKGDKVPAYLQVLQNNNLQNPGFISHFTLKLGKLEPPTRFVCTNLGAALNPGWDVAAVPAMGDSAVGILFDPKAIAAGAVRDMAWAYGIGIAADIDSEGRVSLNVNGTFEPSKEFTVTAYVDDPQPSQSLTLELPAGMTAVQGKLTQGVPQSLADGEPSIVMWKVRVDKLGDFSIKVRSSTGMEYKTLVKIEKAEKAEVIRIQPKPADEQAQKDLGIPVDKKIDQPEKTLPKFDKVEDLKKIELKKVDAPLRSLEIRINKSDKDVPPVNPKSRASVGPANRLAGASLASAANASHKLPVRGIDQEPLAIGDESLLVLPRRKEGE